MLKKDERIDDLEYKGLKIIQNAKQFCFGIDSVILSDFAKKIKRGSKIIDLCTGNGIIGILLCKKVEPEKVYGIEIQEDICEMARRSINMNRLQDKFEIINDNIKNTTNYFMQNSIDAIVTNPPYKKAHTGITNENKSKLIARHEIECTLEDIINVSSEMLKEKGELFMINRPERLADTICNLRKYKLEPKEIRFVQTKISEPPKMFLIRAQKNAGEFLKIEKPLVIYNENVTYATEILKIYNKQ